MKRTLAVVLSVLMVLSSIATVFSTVAFAEEPVSGTYPILSALGHGDEDITILAGKIEGADKSTVADRSAYSHESDFAPGDVNNNGEIDAADYFMVRKYTLGSYELSDEEFLRADQNQDGEVDARDYIAVKKHVLTSGTPNGFSLPDKLTIEEPGYKYEDFALIVVGADNKVVSVNAEEGDKSNTEIPEGGYVIGFNRALLTGDAPKYDISAIKEGTELKLDGITVEEVAALTAPKALEGASFSIAEEVVESGKYPIKKFAGYVASDVSLLLRQEGKTTIGELTGKDYNYYRVILVDKDGFVTEVLEKLGRAEVAHSEGDGRKDLVEIPEGGFGIGLHDDAISKDPDKQIYGDLFGENGVKPGDGIELFGIDLEATAASAKAGDDLAGVSFDLVKYEAVPEEALKIDTFGIFKADICNILVPLATGEKTVGEITAVTTSAAKDYTWWNAIIVDKDGVIVQKIGMVDKTNTEIPEGGYMLMAHGSSASLNVLAGAAEGDGVKLYNVDLKALAELKEGKELKKAAYELTEAPNKEHPVSYQKSYVTTGNTRTDTWKDDGIRLTDGITSETAGSSTASGLPIKDGASVTVDLGQTYAVNKFTVHAFACSSWGIAANTGYAVSYSLDGTNFTDIAQESVKGEDKVADAWTGTLFTIELETPVEARYVKFVPVGGNYMWADEVEVWEDKSASAGDAVIDGTLDDEIWKDAEFKKIDGQTAGTWQNKVSDYTFEYAIVEKDGYAYFGVKSSKADMTQLRVWFHTNPEAKLYTHFFDVYTNGSAGGLKTNQSLTTNSGSAYDASKLEAAFDADKKVFEAKVKLEDVGATTLGADDVNVQISDGNALHSRDFLAGNFTIDGTMVTSAYMPWIGWFDGEIPTYAGLIPKTNHWTLTPIGSDYVKYYYVDDALYVVDEAQWPYMTYIYPEGDEQAYDIEGNDLHYNFSITGGTASIRLIFKTADGTVQYMMTNTALGLTAEQYIASNGDFKATSCSGVISLKELVESKQLYQNSDFPAAAIKDGKITFAGLEIFAIGGATVVINELAVEPAAQDQGPDNYLWFNNNASISITIPNTEFKPGTLTLKTLVYFSEDCEGTGSAYLNCYPYNGSDLLTWVDYASTNDHELGKWHEIVLENYNPAKNSVEPDKLVFGAGFWNKTGTIKVAYIKVYQEEKELLSLTFTHGYDLTGANGMTAENKGTVWDVVGAREKYQATVSVKENAILTDGQTGFDGGWGDVGTSKVLLVANQNCKEDPMVVTILDELDEVEIINSYTLDLYHCSNVMIGYPEGKALISVSKDNETWTDLGEFALAAADLALATHATVSTKFDLGGVEAKYIKIILNVGSNKDVLGANPADGKIYWEFISIAEAGFQAKKIPIPENVLELDEVKILDVITFTADDPSIGSVRVSGSIDGVEYYDLNAGGAAKVDATTGVATVALTTQGYIQVKYLKVEGTDVNGTISATYKNADEGAFIAPPAGPYDFGSTNEQGYGIVMLENRTVDINGVKGEEYVVAPKNNQLIITKKVANGVYKIIANSVNAWPDQGHPELITAGIEGLNISAEGIITLADDQFAFVIVSSGSIKTKGDEQTAPAKRIDRGLGINGYLRVEGNQLTLHVNQPAEVIETNADFSENIWKDAEWIKVDGSKNGTWQNGAEFGSSDYTFDYAMVSDGTYLYIAAKGSKEAMTQLRVWFHTNPEAALYTHFFDVFSDSTKDYGLKTNSSLTENKGGSYAKDKIEYAFDKGAFEVKLALADIGATELEGLEYIVQMSDGVVNLLEGELLYGWTNPYSNMPWNKWVQEEYPQYAGLLPKTNRWTFTPAGDGKIVKYGYEGDVLYLKNDKGWPCMQYEYPEEDRQTYAIEGKALHYDFTGTQATNISLIFADADGETYTFPLSNSALYLNTNEYNAGSGDFKAGTFKGVVPLADLVKAFANYGKTPFPAAAVADGKLTFAGVVIWASGEAAQITVNELAVKDYEPTEGLKFEWVDEWKEANGVSGGTWQETNVPGVPHSYEYAAIYDADSKNVKLGVKFHGKLTGTAASYGNGNGTNIRVWIRDPGTGYVTQNFFLDVSYADGEWKTRLFQNPDATKNGSNFAVYAYDAAEYGYTLATKNTDRGADIELSIPATLVSASGIVQVIFAVSNKDVANYCLYHGAVGGSAAWNPWNGDHSINLSGAPIPEVASISDNLALNKTVTFEGAYASSGTYVGNLTDGVSATAGSYTGVWRAFNKGTGSATIDLGEVTDNVNKVRVNIWPANKSGIVAPTSVKFFVSEDGTNYLEAGMLDMTDSRFKDNSDNAFWFETEFYSSFKARYVKMQVVTDGTFSFFAEIEVYAMKAADYVQPTHGYAYATDSINVIGYKLGKTLGEVKDKTHAWWNLAVVEWDVDAQAYVVTDVKIGNGNDSDFRALEIPLYGFILGCHNTGMPEAAAFIASLKAGDKLYLYDIDVHKITEVDVALSADAMVSKDIINGKTAFDPDVKLGAYKLTNFAKYATGNTVDIFVRQEGKTTLGDLEGKDYNYFRIIVVNKDGVVIDVNEKLGRADVAHSPEDGRKDLVEIPEGGYIIGLHNDAIAADGSVYADLFGADGVKCGDTVTLRNVDLEELATMTVGTELNKYASFDVSKKAFISATASNGRWQTAKDNAALTYKLALADDGEWLYATVIGDGAFATEVFSLRFWIRSSDDATVYTHFYDVNIADDKTVSSVSKYNTSLTKNSGAAIENSSIVYAASAIGDSKTKITFKVKLSEFKGENGFAYYAALRSKSANDYFYYPAPEGTGTPTMPYNTWDVAHEGLYKKDRMDQLGAYKLRSFAAYVNADVNLFVRIKDGETELKTLNEIGNKINGRTTTDYNAYKVFTVDKDGFVTGIYTTIGRPDGVKSDVEVPAGGFAIGVSVYDQKDGETLVRAKDDAALAIFDTLKVGDLVELSNVDFDEVAESHHISAYASFDVHPISEVPEGALTITHFGLYKGDICSILVPLATGEKTVGNITKVTMGSAQNFTWWNAIVADADGKITKVIGMTDKTNVEIPEGGFMILAHGSHPALNVLGTAAAGQIVKLYNVDRAFLTTRTEWRSLVKAAFTLEDDPTIPRPASYQKSYTVTGNTRTDSYKDDGKKLTDGKVSDNGGTAASSGLPNPGASVTIDLGEAMDVNLFKVHAFGGNWGITIITGFTVSISTDGTTFTDLTDASVAGTAEGDWKATWFSITLSTAVNARYVKFVPVGGNYLWADEVEVWGA